MENPLEKFYNRLLKDPRYEVSESIDDFHNHFSDSSRAKKLHGILIEDDRWDDVPKDFNDFYEQSGLKKKDEPVGLESPLPQRDIRSLSQNVRETFAASSLRYESFNELEHLRDIIGEDPAELSIEEFSEIVKGIDSGRIDALPDDDDVERLREDYNKMAENPKDDTDFLEVFEDRRKHLIIAEGMATAKKRIQKEEELPKNNWEHIKRGFNNAWYGSIKAFHDTNIGVDVIDVGAEELFEEVWGFMMKHPIAQIGMAGLSEAGVFQVLKDKYGKEEIINSEEFSQLTPSQRAEFINDFDKFPHIEWPHRIERMAHHIEKSQEAESKMKPTPGFFDLLTSGNPLRIAIGAWEGAMQFGPSMFISSLTFGKGFISMFAGGMFADQMKEHANASDEDLRVMLASDEGDYALATTFGVAAGLLEQYALKGIGRQFVTMFAKKPFRQKLTRIVTEGGRQGVINYIEYLLQYYNYEYARTGSHDDALKLTMEHAPTEEAIGAGLQAAAGSMFMGGMGLAGRQFVAKRQRGQTTHNQSFNTEDGSFGFIGKEGEYFFQRGQLTEAQASDMVESLSKHYPNLAFEVQNNTGEAATSESNYTVKATFRKPDIAIPREVTERAERVKEASTKPESEALSDALEAARDTDWYQALTDEQQKIIDAELSKKFDVEAAREREATEMPEDVRAEVKRVYEESDKVHTEAMEDAKAELTEQKWYSELTEEQRRQVDQRLEENIVDAVVGDVQLEADVMTQAREAYADAIRHKKEADALEDVKFVIRESEQFKNLSALEQQKIMQQVERDATFKTPEVVMPDAIRDTGIEVYNNMIKRDMSPAEAAVYAREHMLKDWDTSALTEEQRRVVSRRIDQAIEDFAGVPTIRRRDVMPTRERDAQFLISIGDRVQMEQRASREGEASAINRLRAKASEMKAEIQSSLEAGVITRARVKDIQSAINDFVASRPNPVGEKNAYQRLLHHIAKANDPYNKMIMREYKKRFDAMRTNERVTKLSDGRKVITGIKTEEYSNLIRNVERFADMESDAAQTVYESERADKINQLETGQGDRSKLIGEIADLDMAYHDFANRVKEFKDILKEFEATKPNEFELRERLVSQAGEALDNMSRLEDKSLAARRERRDAIQQEADQRAEARENIKRSTVPAPVLELQEAVNRFWNERREDRNTAFDNLVAKIESAKHIRNKNKVKEQIAELRKKVKNSEKEDRQAVEKILNTQARETAQEVEPIYGGMRKWVNKLTGWSIMDDMRLLVMRMVQNRDYRDAAYKLFQDADKASVEYTLGGRNAYLKIKELKDMLMIPMDANKDNFRGFKRFIGTETGNSFYIKQAKLGLPSFMEQRDAQGREVAHFDKLSYNDAVHLSIALMDESTVKLLTRNQYTAGTIANLHQHANDIVNANPQLKEFRDFLQKEIFPDIHRVANKPYKKRFGTDMPKTENYFPRVAVREVQRISGDSRSLVPSFAYERGAPREIKLLDVDVLQAVERMYEQANRWNAYYDVLKYWENTYGNNEVQQTIKENVPQGETILKALNKQREHYPDGPADRFFGNQYIINLVMAKIASNVGMPIKQFSSVINAVADYNRLIAQNNDLNIVMAPGLYLAEFGNPTGWARFLNDFSQREVMKERWRRGYEPHHIKFIQGAAKRAEGISKMAVSAESKRKMTMKLLKEVASLPVKSGDFLAFLGIMPNYNLRYRRNIKQGMESEQARAEAFEASEAEAFRTQQPAGRPHLLSAFQIGNIGKQIPFASAPIQMGQGLRQGLLDMFSPVSKPAERVAGFYNAVYFGIVQPAVWGYASYQAAALTSLLVRGVFMGDWGEDQDEIVIHDIESAKAQDAWNEYNILTLLSKGVMQGNPISDFMRDAWVFSQTGVPWRATMMPAVTMVNDLVENVVSIQSWFKDKSWDEFSDYEKRMVRRMMGEVLDVWTGLGIVNMVRLKEMVERQHALKTFWDDYRDLESFDEYINAIEEEMWEDDPEATIRTQEINSEATLWQAYLTHVLESGEVNRTREKDVRMLMQLRGNDRRAYYMWTRRQDYQTFEEFWNDFVKRYSQPLGSVTLRGERIEIHPVIRETLRDRYWEEYGDK